MNLLVVCVHKHLFLLYIVGGKWYATPWVTGGLKIKDLYLILSSLVQNAVVIGVRRRTCFLAR